MIAEVTQEGLAVELGAEAEVKVVQGLLEGDSGLLKPAATWIGDVPVAVEFDN